MLPSFPSKLPQRPPRVVVLGATSIVGWTIHAHLLTNGFAPRSFCNGEVRREPEGVSRLDFECPEALARMLDEERPDWLVHAAAICRVDKCERAPAFAWRVNVGVTETLLSLLPATTRLSYCSSDHVFSGDGGPYPEDAPTDPLTVYGQTRVAAEERVLAHPHSLVLRSGLLLGPSHDGRRGHLDWLRHRTARGLPLTLVADERRSVVWADAFAQRLVALMANEELRGVRHICSARTVDRPRLARWLDGRFGLGVRFDEERRVDRRHPHLGTMELQSVDEPVAGPDIVSRAGVVL